MKKIFLFTLLLWLSTTTMVARETVKSPNGKNRFSLTVTKDGIWYEVFHNNKLLVKKSPIALVFDSGAFGNDLHIQNVSRKKVDETYRLVVGKASNVHNKCNEMKVTLREQGGRRRIINFYARAYDDAVAFRYEFPVQPNWSRCEVLDELTQFNLNGNPTALYMHLNGYNTSHEGLYTMKPYADIEHGKLIEMPLTVQFADKTYLSVTEAALLDYAGAYLVKEDAGLVSRLSPLQGQQKVKVKIDAFPHLSPWRVISMGDDFEQIFASNILTNLCPPCKTDTNWIKPYSTTFTWWNGNVVPDTCFSPGNNFETNKYYIDFAAESGIQAHSIYGYAETPWYYDSNFNFGLASEDADVTRPIRCLDMNSIAGYAHSKNVGIHLWVNWRPLYKQLEKAFTLYEKWGVRGLMVDFMDRNDQEMIKIQEEILACAARHHLAVQFHGSSKPSGLIRTYPNEFTREGTLNYETFKWDTVATADHDISMPFARVLAGPADYHLGGFRALPRENFKIQFVNPYVMSTRCHMMAMYVIMQCHLKMFCDTPTAYQNQEGFKPLVDMPGTWDETRVPLCEFNRYIGVARRKDKNWWVGVITDHSSRDLSLQLDFLADGNYRATIYADRRDAKDMNLLEKKTVLVRRGETLPLHLNKDGGAFVVLKKLD
ncbi:MAG: glycoside hydrolase family 97 protein [Prevotella sp.]|jgi:alpha-glucosidase